MRTIRECVPEVAPLLHRSTPSANADKQGALKLLLLSCALATPEGLPTLLSLTLPLIVGCLHVNADGAQTADDKALATLAHTSLTALAKRSPEHFRAVVGMFTPDTRTRMETALREAAAPTAAPVASAGAGGVPNSPGVGAPPKIALKMDFSAFGKK